LIPEAKELAKENPEATKAIDEVMAMDHHKWHQGLSKEEREKIEEFYRKRYGE
jgi:hypothetical protein